MLNLIFIGLFAIALIGLFLLRKDNRKQKSLINREAQSLKQLQENKSSV